MKKVNELFFMRPWAVKEDLLTPMADIIDRHLSGKKLSKEEIEAASAKAGKPIKPDYEVVNGVARIPIYGVIAKRASMVNQVSQPEGTSVEEIAKNFKAAIKDESVSLIALDIDSPGGSVDGVSEISDLIYAYRAKTAGKMGAKEVYAYANGQMCSAAYWIGSAASMIYATKSTEVGSIGVYAVMTDWTVANHNAGVKREVIKAGRNKATGHPDKPMTEEDRAVVQDEVNTYYKLFTETVMRNRRMGLDRIDKVATGKVFIGSQALDAGLIDGIAEIDSALDGPENAKTVRVEEPAAGITAGNGEQKTQEGETMDLKALTLDELKVARPDLLATLAKDERDAGFAAGKASAEQDASQKAEAEKARVTGILNVAKTLGGVDEAALACIQKGEPVAEAEKSMKAAKLDALAKSAPTPLGGGNSADASQIAASDLPVEEKAEKLWALEETRKDFTTKEALVGYLKAKEKGQVKIYNSKDKK